MTEFKVDMHNLYIRTRKDPKQTWAKLSFIATKNEIYELMAAWPLEWHNPDVTELGRMAAQQ